MFGKILDFLDKVLTFFEEWTLFITVMVALIALFINVVLRYSINYSLAWSEELVREVIIYTTFIGCSAAIRNRSMIKIDALVQLVPVLKTPLTYFSNIVTLIFAGMMIYYGWLMAALQIQTNQKTIIMQIPLVYLYAILPLMGTMMFIRTVQVINDQVRDYEKEMKLLRPTGISILSWLHIIGGVLGIVIFISVKESSQWFGDSLKILGLTQPILVIYVLSLFSIGIASGIGMLNGKRWGWHWGAFYYIFSVASSLNSLIMIPTLMSTVDPAEILHEPSYYYIQSGCRLIIHLLIYLYFYKKNVRIFFGLADQNKWKAILSQIGICIGISAGLTIISHLFT
ncbi:MAG: TRAP transporter small permease [Desulfobacteraceae bacterium]|nr:TRAP transporter small permease [Desulfobacteraceae bacterium]